MTWRKPVPRGLRSGEELIVEVQCRIVDSTGTSLPEPGAHVVVGVTGERILVWDIARFSTQAGKLLGQVSRTRLEHAAIERNGPHTWVRLDFEEDAHLVVEGRRERHPEQIAWALSAARGPVEQ